MSMHNKNTQLLFLTTFRYEKTFLNLINFWLGWLLKFILTTIFVWNLSHVRGILTTRSEKYEIAYFRTVKVLLRYLLNDAINITIALIISNKPENGNGKKMSTRWDIVPFTFYKHYITTNKKYTVSKYLRLRHKSLTLQGSLSFLIICLILVGHRTYIVDHKFVLRFWTRAPLSKSRFGP